METTKEIKCSCKDEWQDKIYGLGRRLMNAFGKPHKGYRCTVCGKENTQNEKFPKLNSK
jgi:hypothetical protein